MSYAGFWKRLAAAFIDGIILIVITKIVLNYVFTTSFESAESVSGMTKIIGSLIAWLYFSIMESSPNQATPGKMLLGIKVTDLQGRKISFGRATARYFSKIISAIILLIGYIMIAFTSKKQGLHDMIAGCLVVNKESEKKI